MRALFAVLFLMPTVAAGEEWGHLSLSFVYDGEPAAIKLLVADKDQEICGKKPIPSERLVVDKETGGIANVIVWLANKKGEVLPVHPSYEESAEKAATLRVRGCRFEPHVLLVRTSQGGFNYKVEDPIGHNAKAEFFANLPFSALTPGNSETFLGTRFPEVSPVSLECSIHPWMQAWLLVRDNPYMAASDAEGNIRIENLPVGDWNFRIWHEQAGWIRSAVRDGADVKWPKGIALLRIKPGENHFGEHRLEKETFRLQDK